MSPWQFHTWGDPELATLLAPVAGAVDASLALADQLTWIAEGLGTDTWRSYSALATLGAVDLVSARALEPHLDALAILSQAGHPDLGALCAGGPLRWGVYAAQTPGKQLKATRDGDHWFLDGVKPWCSLPDELSHALVTADRDGRWQLFAISLDPAQCTRLDGPWAPRGLTEITTCSLELTGAPAVPIGDPGWYLDRAGFWWGGIGVAAVWFGGAAAVAGRLVAAAAKRPDDLVLAALGRVDRALFTALAGLQEAARQIDHFPDRADPLLAARVRAVVADAAEDVVMTVGHALGPAPLAHDADHARRVADLTLYVRQHHAERDLASLGRLVVDG